MPLRHTDGRGFTVLHVAAAAAEMPVVAYLLHSADGPWLATATTGDAGAQANWTAAKLAPPGAVREVSDGVEDAMAIKNRAGGRELDAVVEYVMDAGRMRVLMGPPYHLITFNLSGVSVPSIRRQEDGSARVSHGAIWVFICLLVVLWRPMKRLYRLSHCA